MNRPQTSPTVIGALIMLAVNLLLLTGAHLQLRGVGDVSTIPPALTGWVVFIYVIGVVALVFGIWQGVQAWTAGGTTHQHAPALSTDRILAGLLKDVDAIITIKDTAGRYQQVNARFAAVVKRSIDDVVGKTDADLFPKLVADGLYAGDKQACESAEPVVVNVIYREGADSPMYRARKFCMRDGQGEVLGLCTVARKVTAEADTEESPDLQSMDLVQAQKLEAVGTLAGGLAHDFNNVLTAVLGGLEMAMKDVENGTRLQKRLTRVQKAARRAADLTKQLLTLSRPTESIKGPTDLNAVITAATQLLQRSIPEYIEIRTWLTDKLPLVQADGGQVEQALLNIGVNARDAMPNGGRITFETRVLNLDAEAVEKHTDAQEGRYIQITVTDTGTGMPARVVDRIFEPFFTTKAAGKGTGLGLAMVNTCVKVHGGWLSVDSVVGRGTTFALYIPAAPVPESAAPIGGDVVGQTLDSDLWKGDETILVVDDEESVRDMVGAGLELLGYRVLLADDGEHAIAVLSQTATPIHLVVTDLVMPKCGGQKLVRIIRHREYTMPVLLMTGYVPPSEDDALTDLAFAGIIRKPFTPNEMAQNIRAVLDATPAPAPSAI